VALEVTAPDDADELRLPPGGSSGSDAAAEDDRRELEASDVVSHLHYRTSVFGESYPFVLRDDAVLELRDLTPERCLYLLLLLAANLKYVRSNADQNKLTTYFELLSPDVLRGYLGSEARVELFGTATGEAQEPRYSGALWAKLQGLRDDLRLKLLVGSGHGEIAPNNHGDRGIDFVAWFPFNDDPADTLVIVLGQCACGRRPWPKMLEPSEENWKHIFAFPAPVVNVLVIPQCFRRPDGHWYSKAELRSGVLLDRVRIFESLRRAGTALPIAPDKLPEALLEAVIGEP